MPELPEVETVRRGLEPHLLGTRLSDVRIFRENLRYPFPEGFSQCLEGARITRLDRRAKYLLFTLDSGLIWVTHLGMTGRFQIHVDGSVNRPGEFYHTTTARETHCHLSLTATHGDGDDSIRVRIDYIDPRRFGFMLIYSPEQLAITKWYATLGLEPLSDGRSAQALWEAATNRRISLKALLMDQRIICGLGNIYVCEALFAARLSPYRAAHTLTLEESGNLVSAIRAILEDAIISGGSSISDFAGASGELGYFQHSFRVYDREGLGCTRPGCNGHIERGVQQGRSSFACLACQT